MNVLLTGASGFLGSHFFKTFANHGVCIRPVIRTSTLPPSINSEIPTIVVPDLNSDVDWRCALDGIDVVVHCAARVHVMNDISKNPLGEFRKTNVYGTLNLANQAAKFGIKRFVFVSSIKVNGESTFLGSAFKADDKPFPKDPYGISKMEAEDGLRDLSARTGMEVVIIRPPLIYGQGVKANFATMMQWLRRGVPLPLGGITLNRRSLVFVENLVDLIHICIDHPKAANQTFLISDDEDVSTTALLLKMAEALRCSARLVNISPTLIKLSARFIGKPEIADRLCGSLQVDITKTKELLGWKPKFGLDEGLLRTAASTVTTRDIKIRIR